MRGLCPLPQLKKYLSVSREKVSRLNERIRTVYKSLGTDTSTMRYNFLVRVFKDISYLQAVSVEFHIVPIVVSTLEAISFIMIVSSDCNCVPGFTLLIKERRMQVQPSVEPVEP